MFCEKQIFHVKIRYKIKVFVKNGYRLRNSVGLEYRTFNARVEGSSPSGVTFWAGMQMVEASGL